MLSHEKITFLLSYQEDTGLVYWKNKSSKFSNIPVGEEAGTLDKIHGYKVLKIDGKLYKLHVLIWFYVTGEFPILMVDHKDGNKLNNSYSNLRLATRSQNLCNAKIPKDNKSGIKGVSWHKWSKSWRVAITKDNVCYELGYFKNIEDARTCILHNRTLFHKEFARVS